MKDKQNSFLGKMGLSFVTTIILLIGALIPASAFAAPDITVWTSHFSDGPGNGWKDIAYGNGVYVAVAQSGETERVMTSSDGITWTLRTPIDEVLPWHSIVFGAGLFVAVSLGNDVITSPDGITWTRRSLSSGLDWRSVTYGGGLFVAVASNGAVKQVMTSPDGIIWTSQTGSIIATWLGIAYGNGLFVAVSNSGKVMTSPNGSDWTTRTYPGSSHSWVDIAYGNSLFIVMGEDGDVLRSSNGISWTDSYQDNYPLVSVTYGDGYFIALSRDVLYVDRFQTIDGVTTLVASDIVAAQNPQIITSVDGITWTPRGAPNDSHWSAMVFGDGRFVGVSEYGYGSRVMRSGVIVAPAFTLSASSGSATTGSAISGYSISSTGGVVASYSISPAVSNGTLSFSTSTGLLSGIPSTAAGATIYTITATNTSGSANQTFTLTIDSPAPVAVYVPPTPVPFLKTLTAPQMRLTGGKLVCTAGTYQTGQTLDGVVQTSATALFTPTNYVFNLLFNGQAQSALTKTISSNSVQWDLSIAPSTSTVSCSVTVTANSLTNTEKSTSNTTGLSAANATLAQATTDANNAYSAAQSANSTTYQKTLIDNRALWRKQVENIRANYYETLARITASSASRKMITDKSAALNAMVAAQKKSAADYKASGPAALATKDAANKVALDAKNVAIAAANSSFGTFIESIGYGVLIP